MWIAVGLKAWQSRGRGKKLKIFLGCRTRCALKEEKASAKQEQQLIEFVREVYRVQISHCAKYLICLFCHALVFSIAIAGTEQEINENKDAKETFIHELIQLPPKLRPFLCFKSVKSAFFFFPLLLQGCSGSPLFFSFPLCPMYEWADNCLISTGECSSCWRQLERNWWDIFSLAAKHFALN